MCGIAGYSGNGDEPTLRRMIGALAHRGPDDTGVWESRSIGFAHARLAIIDLSSAGHQPMHGAAGSVTITFNGEIYNYQTLREELQKRGRYFRSTSDTEVIIELYKQYGEEAFARLEGMYAFALYDHRMETLYLVRDRMGEKPLYWTEVGKTLVFGSEIKALLQHPLVPRTLNQQGVLSYLTYDAVLTPGSMFEHIHKLEPATYAKYAGGTLTTHVYWTPPQRAFENLSFSDAQTRLDHALERSVASQMVADVPVGVFLSGGLDSSLVAYYAKRGNPNPVHTFSLGFTERTFDESSYARAAASALGTVHHERTVRPDEVRKILEEVIDKLDEPVADPAILPTYLLSSFAREHVKVALGGDGGDELFLGYQTFTAERLVAWYLSVPAVIRRAILEPAVARMPVSHGYFSLDFKAKQFLRGVHTPERYRHQAWLESFSAEERSTLVTADYQVLARKRVYERIDDYVAEMPEADAHMQAAYFYLRTYMQDVILTKVDRASMMHGLEVRAPLLDRSVVELALQIPWRYKQYGLTGKYILRKLMEGKLPHDIVWRGKHGFGLPVGQWFRGEWRKLLTTTLSHRNVQKVGVFDPAVVELLVAQHINGTHNHRKKLWSLLVFQLWYDRWIA